jgi:hypothetical protein
MNQEISKSTFKAQTLKIMRGVEQTGDEVVITAHRKPTLAIKQFRPNSVTPLEKLKDSVINFSDPLSPVNKDEWELESLIVVDTHILIWWVSEDAKLSHSAKQRKKTLSKVRPFGFFQSPHGKCRCW